VNPAAQGVVPLVDYLHLEDPPYLTAHECVSCGALYFDRRNGCAACFGTEFRLFRVAREGVVRTFTIVSVAAPSVEVPFVAAVVDCGGVDVRANLVNVEPDPEHVRLGLRVRLVTYELGRDSAGTTAIGFGFEPVEVSGE
jgi:uncharacterized OB-fold protein